MPPFLKTHMNRAFDHLDTVIYVMNEVQKGKNAKEIKRHLVEDDPFSHRSREYRSVVSNWLVSDFVTGFSAKALPIFAKMMVSERTSSQLKREILFWKTCERDALARELTLGPIYTAYHAHEPNISTDALIDIAITKGGLSQTTARRCVENYFTLAKKVGFLSSIGSVSNLNFFRPKQNAVAAVLFFLFDSGLSPVQILRAPDFKYLLLDDNALLSILSDLRSVGVIAFASAGNVVRLEPKIAFEVLPDAFEE